LRDRISSSCPYLRIKEFSEWIDMHILVTVIAHRFVQACNEFLLYLFYSRKIHIKAVFETFGFGLYSLDADFIMTSDLHDPEVEFRVLDFCLKMRFEPLNF
jgi:hypothetical protein